MAKKETEIKREVPLLEEKEVWDTLAFARAAAGTGIAGMPLTIDLLNQKLKDISLLSTGEVTATQVSDALSDPKNNEE